MDDTVSLISVSDKVKTSEKFDYMVDMEVKKILDVTIYFILFVRNHTKE